ncbi:nuclear transport factor 2 family protein [Candidatus Woesearchaeota archaeon]|nr:nuclear transport factor 2 family protein [Candidatus Woesearchaeota archaeon]
MNKAKVAIRKMYREWKPYWESGDAAKVVSYYTDDCVQMPIGDKEVVGKKAFEASLKSLFKTSTVKGNSTNIKEIGIGKRFAFARGTYALTVTPKKKGKSIKYKGKFLHIYKKQGSKWKIYRAIGGDE